jgi:hypothetical protein
VSTLSKNGSSAPQASSDQIVAGARRAIGARLGIPAEIAYEMLRGLARSQGRELHEYAAAVVANGGRLDG